MLVSKVLPKPLLGFFTACLFGAILSTFNSFINSAATLFCYDIYRPIFKKDISDEDLIKVAKIAGTIIAIVSMIIAPLLQYGTGGLFLLLKRFAGFFNIPIVALVAVGFLNKTISGKAARIVVLLHVILYYSLVWIFKVQINFTHVMGGLFVFDIVAMFILGSIFKRETPYVPSTRNKSNVDLSDWKYVREFSALLIIGLAYLYAVLSPIGLAGGNGLGKLTGIFVILTVIILFVINKTKGKKEKKIVKEAILNE